MKLRQLLSFAVMIICVRIVTCSSRSSEQCFIELARVIIGLGSRNRYSLLCKCAPQVAKVFFSVPVAPGETAGKSEATVNCIAREERRLTSMCNRLNETEFQRHAFPVLDRCVNHPILTSEEAEATQPFTFNTEKCSSKVAWTQGTRVTSVAWVCECSQFDFYEVTPGWAKYDLRGDAIDAAQEFTAIRRCAEEATEQMQEVCKNNPSDYYILGLHILQTCCKRARVNSEPKFECAAAVPDDLSQLKVVR
ncbi:hypothetical protein BWQ96_02554 [Gracilariopsis chorda]|uniref:Uncharacterized protein n=1 Tax=Gracilariopsis chorda TaxID=448386 RepID=A0A2V3IZV5_9FLOR|nr:hypothetical protein BWQ96_02554 [Gracilariopsis chorda]|eukprot:PXF47692.1 hypothetical protein BWQ96_02554 [Gracilariopsis chorda]